MSSIPAFHTKAAKEAADRMRGAIGERDRAGSFLEALDELLTSDARLSPSSLE